MPETAAVIGIDTSNYTTSVALLDTEGRLLANIKRPLPVKDGECGLRQSDAVFAHVKNLPSAMKEAEGILSGRPVAAVGVSTKPRNAEGSYMPCFLVGAAEAAGLQAALHVPTYAFSHQCGHIMAALYSAGREDLLSRTFGAFHVSGGTTEVLRVTPDNDGFHTEVVGGGADLHAGQLIDRVGVYMGMPFPAGRHMEEAALKNKVRVSPRKPSVCGMTANLSGFENLAKALYDDTGNMFLTSAFVLRAVSDTLVKLGERYIAAYGEMPIVFAGGVMSNSAIKADLARHFDTVFAEPAMSADNAVGVAALALRSYREGKDHGFIGTP